MSKFLAIVKREYLKRVRTKSFIVATLLGPLLMLVFILVPVLLALLGSNETVRIAVVDQSGRMYERVRDTITRTPDESDEQAVGRQIDPGQSPQERARQMGADSSGGFTVEQVNASGRAIEEVKRELNRRVFNDELGGYLIIPADVLTTRRAEYYARNVGDLFTRGHVEESLSRAVNEQRLADAGVDPSLLDEASRRVQLSAVKVSEKGEEKDSGAAFFFVLALGFLIFMAVLLYGTTILSAVIEEKQTRVVEILFSSVRAFPLMLGKLIGVSLVALTQFAIWGVIIGGFVMFGLISLAGQGTGVALPHVGAGAVIYFFLLFLLGYFTYASLFALVGAVVTTQEESQQFVMLAVFPLLIAFYLIFPVMRGPDSALAVWTSIIPFTSPVVMLVRIVAQTPPFWQILLSLVVNFLTAVLVVWLSARIYRVGMLMYGKRATIPEIWRWMRKA